MTTPKTEALLKRRLMERLRLRMPHFQMLQFATRAAPDWAIVGGGKTTYWEMKHATPDFNSPGDQTLMAMRLAVAGGFCRYILWQEGANGCGQRTLIVHPKIVHERTDWRVIPEAFVVGFDHGWLADYIYQRHTR